MSRYTYLACDLLTNAVLAELPLTGVQFTNSLNGAGPFSGQLVLSSKQVAKIDPINSTMPARTALYVDRDGVLVWGGIIWTRKYDSTNYTLSLDGTEFWSYFERRFIDWTVSETATDQIQICSDVLNAAQAKAGGNIGVLVNPGGVTSGVPRDLDVYSYELKPVAEAVTDFATLDDGFDFAIDVFYDSSGNPAKVWRPGYPRRGRTVAATGWLFENPGNVIDYQWNEDATAQATTLYVVGTGEGDDMATSVVSAPDMIDAGYPLLDGQVSVKDTSDPNLLAARARAESDALKTTVTVPQINVRADMDPVLGSYIVGDDVRLRITDFRFPATLDTFERITSIQVTPPDSSQSTSEQVTLTLDEAI